MTTTPDNERPRLRPLDFRPINQNGQRSILLRDPLQLSDLMVAVPQQLGPALALCDGTHDRAGLRASLITQYQLLIGTQVLDQLVTALDDAYLLDNDRYRAACRERLAEYRAAPYRTPALAGQSYPADPGELAAMLDDYLEAAGDAPTDHRHADGRGLLSPHIDYDRGGPVYAAVWKSAAEMVRAADLAIILGTDHYGGRGSLTLTGQSYATPFGVLPTPADLVEAAAAAIGPEAAFAEELHHRNEHSIELAAVWLHHMRGGRPIDMLPVLCGSFAHFVSGAADPADDEKFSAFVDALRPALAGRRAIVVAAGDLSHVGPAFDGPPQGTNERARVAMADDTIIERMCTGEAAAFFASIQRIGDRNNVCGLPPIYLSLRLLAPATGERVAYDRCPADEADTSFVSVGGVVWD
jgi:AmmeMemoRadiSam system protein B